MTAEQAPDLRVAVAEMIRKHRGLIIFEGIVFIVIGIAAILFPFVASIAAEIFLGALFIVVGFVSIVRVGAAKGMPGRAVSLLLALITFAGGVLLLIFVGPGMLALTLVLAAFFLARGVLDIFYGIGMRSGQPGRAWSVVSGIVGVAVGLLIWAQWPSDAPWVLGTLAGIDLIFSGFAFLALASAAKDLPAGPPAQDTGSEDVVEAEEDR